MGSWNESYKIERTQWPFKTQELRLRLRERKMGNSGKKLMDGKKHFSAYDTMKVYYVPRTVLKFLHILFYSIF